MTQRAISWIVSQKQVLLAVILQDMKTRFGSSYLSYLIAVAWPFTHVSAIAIGYLITNHFAPVGDDPLIFVVTAAVPYMLCLYPARLVATAILINKPFLNYNIVTPMHLISARVILEFLNVMVVVLLIFVVGYLSDSSIVPISTVEVAAAISASVFLGTALGFFFAIWAAILGQFFIMLIIFVMIFLYIGSMPFVPDYLLAGEIHSVLVFNPIFCLIKWMRSGYYYAYQITDNEKLYCVGLAVLFVFLGFLAERLLRGRVIS